MCLNSVLRLLFSQHLLASFQPFTVGYPCRQSCLRNTDTESFKLLSDLCSCQPAGCEVKSKSIPILELSLVNLFDPGCQSPLVDRSKSSHQSHYLRCSLLDYSISIMPCCSLIVNDGIRYFSGNFDDIQAGVRYINIEGG